MQRFKFLYDRASNYRGIIASFSHGCSLLAGIIEPLVLTQHRLTYVWLYALHPYCIRIAYVCTALRILILVKVNIVNPAEAISFATLHL